MQLKILVHQKQKLETTTRSRIYATSASCSVAEEGVAEAAPAVEGSAGSAVAGVEEAGVEEVAEAAKGEINNTMAGANFFAFSKKDFSS
jgi:hypothetical protein